MNIHELRVNSGTKALSNVTEGFSKLNKLSHSIGKSIGKKSDIVDGIKPTFTVGKRELSGKKSGSSFDNSSNSGSDENINMILVQTERPTDLPDKSLIDSYSPSIGIIMGMKNNEVDEVGKDVATDGHLSRTQLNGSDSSSQRNLATTPEITVQGVGENFGSIFSEKMIPPSTLNLPKNISHSSGEVDSKGEQNPSQVSIK